jgi:hypothetical protein
VEAAAQAACPEHPIWSSIPVPEGPAFSSQSQSSGSGMLDEKRETWYYGRAVRARQGVFPSR